MKARTVACALVIGCALILFAMQPVRAADINITIEPGQQAFIPMKFWCLDYGKAYPPIVSTMAERAPDGVIAVLQSAIARDTVNTNPYQTQLAIWRVTTGVFNDYANKGTQLAEEIYNESLTIAVAPIPPEVQTLAKLIASGSVTITLQDFGAEKDTINVITTGDDFFGTATMVVTNLTQDTVSFLFVEGSVFAPPVGSSAQAIVGHAQPTETQPPNYPPPELPPTGADLRTTLLADVLIAGAGGVAFLSLTTFLYRRRRASITGR